MAKLTAMQVRRAKAGRHADGRGVYLLLRDTGSRSWVLRVQVDGVRRDIGLGSVELNPDWQHEPMCPCSSKKCTFSLKRATRRIFSKLAQAGRDPIIRRDKDRQSVPTFKEAAEACKDDMKADSGPKTAAAFPSSWEDRAFGHIGRFRVDHLEASHIRDLLAPIWMTKPEQARKVPAGRHGVELCGGERLACD
jgi:hypothetical protein